MTDTLTKESRKFLSRWAKDEYYVYIRPMTSRFIDRSKKHKLYWVVSVEFRRMDEPKTFRGEGYDLNEVLAELAERVPRRKEAQPGYVGQQVTKKNAGYLMAHAAVLEDDEVKEIRKKRKKDKESVIITERPRKRTKPAKKKK